MKHTLRSIISITLLLVSLSAFSQQKDTIAKPKTLKVTDTVAAPKTQRYGLRVGIDLYRLARTFYEDGYRSIELTGDYRLTKRFYLAGELGNTDYTIDDDQVNFTTNGTYFKVGFDYNTYENWLDMQNMIYIGMRYSASSFSQTLNSYNIYDPSGYFEQTVLHPNQKYKGLSAQWIEVVGGIKAELFSNIYLGFSLRLKNLISNKKPDNFDNLYIPGFDRTYDGNFGVGFTYTLSYAIPLYRKAK